MAPLFTSLADTQEKQRLGGLEAGHPVLKQLDLTVREARAEYYTRLGLSRLNALLGITPADPPTTDDHYLALLASTTEQKLVRRSLLQWLTVNVKEGEGGRPNQEWNDVSAFRQISAARLKDEVERLDAEIERAFSLLSGNTAPGDAPACRATAIGRGMLAASAIAIFLIPVTFYVVEKLSHRKKEAEKRGKDHA